MFTSPSVIHSMSLIFDLMPAKDLANLRLASKAYSGIIRESPAWRRNLSKTLRDMIPQVVNLRNEPKGNYKFAIDIISNISKVKSVGNYEKLGKILRAQIRLKSFKGYSMFHTLDNSEDFLFLQPFAGPSEIIDSYGNTMFHAAAYNGLIDVLKSLDYTKYIDVPNNRGEFACHYAAYNGHCKTLKYLLKRMSDPPYVELINIAARFDHANILNFLVHSRYIKQLHIDDECLKTAVERNSIRFVQSALKNFPELADAQDSTGLTLAHSAAREGSLETLCAVTLKMSIKNPKDQNGETPMALAFRFGHFRCFEYLESTMMDEIHRIYEEDKILKAARHAGDAEECLKIHHRILPYVQDRTQVNDSLMYALQMSHEHVGCVEYLCQNVVDFDYDPNYLYYLVQNNKVQSLRVVLPHFKEKLPRFEHMEFLTPFDIAVKDDKVDVVEVYLPYVNQEDLVRDDLKPSNIHVAAMHGLEWMLITLMDNVLDKFAKDHCGDTVLDVVVRYASGSCILFLFDTYEEYQEAFVQLLFEAAADESRAEEFGRVWPFAKYSKFGTELSIFEARVNGKSIEEVAQEAGNLEVLEWIQEDLAEYQQQLDAWEDFDFVDLQVKKSILSEDFVVIRISKTI